MSYSIAIAIDDGHNRVLEARLLHVSLEDEREVILYHDLIGHRAFATRLGSRARRGENPVCVNKSQFSVGKRPSKRTERDL